MRSPELWELLDIAAGGLGGGHPSAKAVTPSMLQFRTRPGTDTYPLVPRTLDTESCAEHGDGWKSGQWKGWEAEVRKRVQCCSPRTYLFMNVLQSRPSSYLLGNPALYLILSVLSLSLLLPQWSPGMLGIYCDGKGTGFGGGNLASDCCSVYECLGFSLTV